MHFFVVSVTEYSTYVNVDFSKKFLVLIISIVCDVILLIILQLLNIFHFVLQMKNTPVEIKF